MPEHDQMKQGTGTIAQFFAVLAGPVVWFTQLCISYFMISVGCGVWAESAVVISLHVISGITTVIVLVALATAWRMSQQTAPAVDEALDDPDDRLTFMGAAGLLMETLFTIVVVGTWLAVFFMSPC